jgi:hypothetical protein
MLQQSQTWGQSSLDAHWPWHMHMQASRAYTSAVWGPLALKRAHSSWWVQQGIGCWSSFGQLVLNCAVSVTACAWRVFLCCIQRTLKPTGAHPAAPCSFSHLLLHLRRPMRGRRVLPMPALPTRWRRLGAAHAGTTAWGLAGVMTPSLPPTSGGCVLCAPSCLLLLHVCACLRLQDSPMCCTVCVCCCSCSIAVM